MKKNGLWVIILAVCLLLAGCGRSDPMGENAAPYNSTPVPVSEEPAKPSEAGSEASAVPTQPEPVGEPEIQPSGNTSEETEASSTRTLVVYFSRTGEQYTVGVIDKGNTAIVAEMIAEETGADLFEVLPVDDHYLKKKRRTQGADEPRGIFSSREPGYTPLCSPEAARRRLTALWAREPDALTFRQAAALAGYADGTVLRWIKKGKFMAVPYFRDYMIPKAAFINWLAVKTQENPKFLSRRHIELLYGAEEAKE